MGRPSRYSPEERERAVRMVLEHEREYDSQWVAIRSNAAKIGCWSETLRHWVRAVERDTPLRRTGRSVHGWLQWSSGFPFRKRGTTREEWLVYCK